MIRQAGKRYLWGSLSPVACLAGGGLLIMASDRLAHAITVTIGLIWVYCLTTIAAHTGSRIFPRRGRLILLAFLASFIACLFLFLLWLFSPYCALEMFFIISLVPLFCIGSGVYRKLEEKNLGTVLGTSFTEALAIGILIIIFAVIREPFGFLSLSLPGGSQGIILLFSFETEKLKPVRLIAGSSGALLLLGYILGFYYYLKAKNQPGEENR